MVCQYSTLGLSQHDVSVRLQESSTGIPHPLQHVDAEARSWAKALAYGLLYGKTAHSFKDDMGCDLETAQRTMDDFLDSLPDLVSIYSPSSFIQASQGVCVLVELPT